jgi:asparagine synthase (glutamine-hydrolysing)
MGGFFLVTTRPDNARSVEVQRLRRAFADLGFAAPEVIATENYVLAAYPSIEGRLLALRRYRSGDFVYICGTCLCAGGVEAAVGALLYGRAEAAPADDALMGHYAAVVRRGRRTEIRLDRFGGYHLFYNLAVGIVSSSFYAASAVLTRLTLSQQSACEYVFNGVVSGNETLFNEVALAPIGATIRVGADGLEIVRPRLPVTRAFSSQTRAASLECSMALLDRYFAAAAGSFGDRVGCALSGGYDSRLMLGLMRRHAIRPRVFVYGRAAERDVRLAGDIARGEGFALAVIDKSDHPVIPAAEFGETARRNFLAADGYGWGGIFENGAEIAESARRVHDNAIAFNGGGGEIFRNFFYLPDREYTIRELLWSFYSRFDPAVGMPAFDATGYYGGLERKVMDLLGSDDRRLPRPTVEWLYHSFRCRSWDGKVDSIAGRYGFTAMPYLERAISEHASALPLAWKNHGGYEAELIRRADPRLARYPSAYGHDFAGAPPLSRRLADYATYLRPPWLRRYTYRVKHLRRRRGDWPGYLASPYREAVLPGGATHMRRLFRLDRVADPDQFARILSLEYAIRHFDARVGVDF